MLEIKKDIYWVGAVDFKNRDFHGYSLSPSGTTYNAYLVRDAKNVLFDTVKAGFYGVMRDRLSEIMPPEKIDYIVINHVELDHAACLPEFIKLCKPECVFCSPMGEKAIKAHFQGWQDWPLKTVKTGDKVNIGRRNIHFIETPMLHWPDSMLSYIPEDKLLISNDAFGQNVASSERFADELSREYLEHAMTEYYHNIVLPYSRQVLDVLGKVEKLGLEIDMIAPDHGLIFRGQDQVGFVLGAYKRFAEQKTQKRAVIVYDTMWHSTESMAYAIGEGLGKENIPFRLMDLKQNHHSAVMTEVARCGLVAVGSPTLNNGVLPLVSGFLAYMKGLRPKNRLGAAFGSYGWSGECLKVISDELLATGMELPVEALRINYVPGKEDLAKCEEMGATLGMALSEKCAGVQD